MEAGSVMVKHEAAYSTHSRANKSDFLCPEKHIQSELLHTVMKTIYIFHMDRLKTEGGGAK